MRRRLPLLGLGVFAVPGNHDSPFVTSGIGRSRFPARLLRPSEVALLSVRAGAQ